MSDRRPRILPACAGGRSADHCTEHPDKCGVPARQCHGRAGRHAAYERRCRSGPAAVRLQSGGLGQHRGRRHLRGAVLRPRRYGGCAPRLPVQAAGGACHHSGSHRAVSRRRAFAHRCLYRGGYLPGGRRCDPAICRGVSAHYAHRACALWPDPVLCRHPA